MGDLGTSPVDDRGYPAGRPQPACRSLAELGAGFGIDLDLAHVLLLGSCTMFNRPGQCLDRREEAHRGVLVDNGGRTRPRRDAKGTGLRRAAPDAPWSLRARRRMLTWPKPYGGSRHGGVGGVTNTRPTRGSPVAIRR